MQDIPKENKTGISLKKVMGNLGLSIIESSVSFDIKRPLTSFELEEVIRYCSNDVLGVKELYKFRSKYFETKLIFAKQIIKSFAEGTTGTVNVKDPEKGYALVDKPENLLPK
jgi:hypothetical protein